MNLDGLNFCGSSYVLNLSNQNILTSKFTFGSINITEICGIMTVPGKGIIRTIKLPTFWNLITVDLDNSCCASGDVLRYDISASLDFLQA